MFVIAPLSNCASTDKRDRFLEFISAIAPVTHATEPKCHAYAWFRSAADNETVPHHWVRGLEVYEDIEANTISHRASAEYKAFRAAVGEEGLLERPSDLRFWRPASVGFLTRANARPNSMNFMRRDRSSQYIVVDELTPDPGQKHRVLETLQVLAREAEGREKVLSFWVLHRGDGELDESVMVFARYEDRDEFCRFDGSSAAAEWKAVRGIKRTTWVESGLGFLGRP
ncbi:hypothetical protein BJX99DRAFT_230192 [Aspergillus californicus]